METPFTDFLETAFDKALGVFDRVIDLELGEKELDIVREVSIFKAAQASEQDDPNSLFGTGGGTIAGIDQKTLLIVGGIGIAALLLLRG